MLTIKKSSFLFRFWLAIMHLMPEPWCCDAYIEKELTRASLCTFAQQIFFFPFVILLMFLTASILMLMFGPVFWIIASIVMFIGLMCGYVPEDALERLNGELKKEDEKPFLGPRSDRFMLWCYLPMEIAFPPKRYRRYRTLTIFGRSIYPIHLIVPAIMYWIWTAGADAYRTSPDFAHQVDILGWVLAILVVIVGLIMGILTLEESDTGKLIRAYLKAKKDRVCPRVEFIDDEQNT